MNKFLFIGSLFDFQKLLDSLINPIHKVLFNFEFICLEKINKNKDSM